MRRRIRSVRGKRTFDGTGLSSIDPLASNHSNPGSFSAATLSVQMPSLRSMRRRIQTPSSWRRPNTPEARGARATPSRSPRPKPFQHLCSTPTEWSLHFVLLEDLDLAGCGTDADREARRRRSPGVFDGQGHAIRNGIIDQVDNPYVGLFGWVGESGACPSCLGLEDMSVSGTVDLGSSQTSEGWWAETGARSRIVTPRGLSTVGRWLVDW